jgi:ABC-type phosphate transport system substrate-binding protein
MTLKRAIFIIAVLFGCAFAPPARASDLVVIANSEMEMSQISAGDLRAIFLGTKTSLKDARAVRPVLKKPGPQLADFCLQYLGKTETGLLIYYRSLVFTGKWSMPASLNSDAEVVAYVANTRGAIGFVGSATDLRGVKTLKVNEHK